MWQWLLFTTSPTFFSWSLCGQQVFLFNSKFSKALISFAAAHNVWVTHLSVLKEGPAFPEETAAADNLWTLSLVLPVIVALSALVDLVLVFIFQKWFHPLREIIVNINNRERPTIEMASFDEGEIWDLINKLCYLVSHLVCQLGSIFTW